MDAEVWSHADIRNGRRLFILIVLAILFKEGATIYALTQGYDLTGVGVPAGGLPFAVPSVVRVAVALGFSILLLVFAFAGQGWARISLGLLYLVSAGEPLWRAVGTGVLAELSTNSLLSMANHLAGIALGLTLILAPQLRAFAWSQSQSRLTIPVPADGTEGVRRGRRRARTIGEVLLAAFSMAGNALAVLLILGLGAFVYGFGDLLLALIQR